MFKRSCNRNWKIQSAFVVCMFYTLCVAAQADTSTMNKRFGIVSEFVKNNTEQNVSEVASNVLRVSNCTKKTVRFHLRFSIPMGWQMMKQNNTVYELAPGDSAFVPIRIIMEKLTKGNMNYVVSAFLISDHDQQFASQNWYVTIQNQSQWSAIIPTKKIFFVNNSDSSGFNVHFTNTGNADEMIHLSFNTDRRIEVINPASKQIVSAKIDFSLPVGADTTLNFGARRKKDLKIPVNKKEGRERTDEANEEYIIQAAAKNDGFFGKGIQSWTGTVSFFKIGNEKRVNDFKRAAAPLTLEMNAYDVLSNSTTMSLDAYGNEIMKNDQLLNYRFQTVFITNFLNEKTFLGNNHYIGYFSHKGSIEIGEIGGWGRSMINGKGIRGMLQKGSNQVGAVITKAPDFFSDSRIISYGFYHHYEARKINFSNYYSHIADDNIHQLNTLYSSYASFKINNNHQIGIGGGFSNENYFASNPFVAKGYGYDLNYSVAFKRVFFTLTNQYGNSNYSLARGLWMTTGRITYYINKQLNLSLSNQKFSQNASYYFSGTIIPGRNIRSDRYEARLGFLSTESAIYLKPSYTDEENYSLHVITKGLGLEYNARNLSDVRLSTNAFMGYSKTPDYDIPNFFIAHAGVNAKWNHLNLSLRYSFGPNQVSEQLRFVQNKINPQSVNVTSSYDHWFGKGSYLLTTNSGLLYETFFNKLSFRIKPEFFLFSKTGFRFSVYATYITTSQGANPMLTERQLENGSFQKVTTDEFNVGFGIKKQIGVPIPGKKFKSIKVVVFKDFNGNRIQDANEEGVENILINMRLVKSVESEADSTSLFSSHGDDFITNNNGEINYNNIPAGIYHLKMIPLTQTGEWFEGKEEDVVVNGKQIIYLPLSKGIKLSGSILVERDKYSGVGTNPDLSHIRITAIDSSGKSYSSLTDKNGSFSTYLPMGIYTLSVNEAALGENFVCIQNNMVLDLTKPMADNYSITFNVSERKRKMEIKKFNSSGEEQK